MGVIASSVFFIHSENVVFAHEPRPTIRYDSVPLGDRDDSRVIEYQLHLFDRARPSIRILYLVVEWHGMCEPSIDRQAELRGLEDAAHETRRAYFAVDVGAAIEGHDGALGEPGAFPLHVCRQNVLDLVDARLERGVDFLEAFTDGLRQHLLQK